MEEYEGNSNAVDYEDDSKAVELVESNDIAGADNNINGAE